MAQKQYSHTAGIPRVARASAPIGFWTVLTPTETEARERARAIRCGDVRREMFHDLKPVYRWRWL